MRLRRVSTLASSFILMSLSRDFRRALYVPPVVWRADPTNLCGDVLGPLNGVDMFTTSSFNLEWSVEWEVVVPVSLVVAQVGAGVCTAACIVLR